MSTDRRRASRRAWYALNDEAVRVKARAAHQVLRLTVLNAYGGKCVCCGEHRPQFLALDHVDGGGLAHRKTLAKHVDGSSLSLWAKRDNYPAVLRVLCHNCNLARGFYKVCPHETETLSIPEPAPVT